MWKHLLAAALAVCVLAAAQGLVPAASAQNGGWNGPPWMGPGMMWGGPGGGPGWMGPWLMGRGGWMGPGMMYGYGPPWMHGGGGGPQQQPDLDLSVDQVKSNLTRWLAADANPHLTLGDVKAKDADTITAEIVTKDKNALVERYEINRHNGYMQPVD